LIGPIFNGKIGDRWPNIWKYRFWQTIFTRSTYLFRQSFPPHKQLPVAKEHFDRWMEIFTTTTDELFAGARAEENCAPIWLRCSTTKSTILEMPTKRRSLKSK
jgi:hemoglobin